MIDVAGQDATDSFEDVGHSDEAREILEGLKIGTLKRLVWKYNPRLDEDNYLCPVRNRKREEELLTRMNRKETQNRRLPASKQPASILRHFNPQEQVSALVFICFFWWEVQLLIMDINICRNSSKGFEACVIKIFRLLQRLIIDKTFGWVGRGVYYKMQKTLNRKKLFKQYCHSDSKTRPLILRSR